MSGVIRALLVDDEAPARSELRYLLEQTGDQVVVMGEAPSGEEALRLAAEGEPDVVFLDIMMSGCDGLEVAQELLKLPRPPLVIFATAYDRYALRAFELKAVDYLLKPFRGERVRAAVERVKTLLADDRGLREQLQRLLALLEGGELDWMRPAKQPRGPGTPRIPVEKKGRICLLDPREIRFAYSEARVIFVRTRDEHYRCRFTFTELEEKLGPRFMRVQKSFLVNLDHVKEMIPWFRGTFLLVMDDDKGTEIPVSRLMVGDLRRALLLD